MKKNPKSKKLLILALIVILGPFAIYALQLGFKEITTSAESIEERLVSPEKDAELIINTSPEAFITSKDKTLPFTIFVKVEPVEREGHTKLSFDVVVNQPVNYMDKVTISAVLPEKFFQYLDASFLWFSNVDAALDKGAPDEYLALDPLDTSKRGIAVSRTFLLNAQTLSVSEAAHIKEMASDIKVKVSWVDSTGLFHDRYVKMEKEDIEINIDALIN